MDAERIANLITFTIVSILIVVLVLTDHLETQAALTYLVGGSLPSPNLTISSAMRARKK